ncbi:MAG: acyl-CoA carboxylase epsilon subunit [Candidatus Nanopelagicales bacterium]
MTGAASTESNAAAESQSAPLLRIVGGNPSPEDVAAVVAVVSAAAASASGGAESEPAVAAWSQPSGMHRRPMPVPSSTSWVNTGRRY